MSLMPSKRVAPDTYISRKTVLCRLARLNCAISMLHSDMSASAKLDPSSVASKKLAPYRLDPLKLVSRTMLCWKATPRRFCPEKSLPSRLTPRVMAMVLPDCSVDAPPVVILALALVLAPVSANAASPAKVRDPINAVVAAVLAKKERNDGILACLLVAATASSALPLQACRAVPIWRRGARAENAPAEERKGAMATKMLISFIECSAMVELLRRQRTSIGVQCKRGSIGIV
mmetsp:Transcript_1160/g.3381  ORF Transcript_1160/g.3381 Transcript_1160/m.3381 type:complete len:232 (-) Transcript_1160:84-779(-)